LLENAEFLRFASHWSFRIRACRPYRARTEGKVKRPICFARQSFFFYGRCFADDDSANCPYPVATASIAERRALHRALQNELDAAPTKTSTSSRRRSLK
jgi:transposase